MNLNEPIPSCSFPGCKQPHYRNGYCVNHNRIYGSTEVVKEKYTIPPKSKKREVLDRQYSKLVKEMLAEDDRCEVKVPGVCTKKAQGLQHKEKRSEKNLMKRDNLLRCCNACNGWIEKNPLEAIAMGVSVSKHIKN